MSFVGCLPVVSLAVCYSAAGSLLGLLPPSEQGEGGRGVSAVMKSPEKVFDKAWGKHCRHKKMAGLKGNGGHIPSNGVSANRHTLLVVFVSP